ncbi:MAG TPA: hypothetical protein VIK70_04890 [Lysobacter sp.]
MESPGMTHTLLLDIDPVLLERIQRVATAHGWGQQHAMIHLLEHGLFACEADLKARFDEADSQVLLAAIAALQDIPDDPGFSLIGRAGPEGNDR